MGTSITRDQAADPAAVASGAAQELTDRYRHALLPVFGDPMAVLVRGRGAVVWDADGKEYLDLLGGIAVNALGHAHPDLIKAVTGQLATLGHVSNFFASTPQIRLAERLLDLIEAPEGSKVFFANSGTEANEAAFKIARRTGKPRILALEHAFHGRTMGALALTHKAKYREPFEPLPGGVEHIPAGHVGALAAALAPGDVAALFLEPILGEAGVIELPGDYLRAARELTAAHGALLIVDEVQTGMGRTGAWFAHRLLTGEDGGVPIVPDVVTLAKGLGGGIPIGAALVLGKHASSVLGGGEHGTTFGGNPVATAAGLAVTDVIERDHLLAHVTDLGEHLRGAIAGLRHPLIADVRGRGFLIGIGLNRPLASRIVSEAQDAGYIVNAAAAETVRLAPPYVLSREQADRFVADLPGVLDRAVAAADGEGER